MNVGAVVADGDDDDDDFGVRCCNHSGVAKILDQRIACIVVALRKGDSGGGSDLDEKWAREDSVVDDERNLKIDRKCELRHSDDTRTMQ